jgi:integrase/recombinase XerD
LANRKQKLVGLYLRYRTPEGKQSPCRPVLYDAKNRLRPGWCLVIDVEERHPDCTYHLRYKRDGVWNWEAVGDDPNTAMALRAARSLSYTDRARVPAKAGVKATATAEVTVAEPDSESIPSPEQFRLDDEIKTYLSNVEKLAPKTYKAYRLTMADLFPQSCKRIYVHQVTKQDLQAFDSFLLKRGDEDRTRANRVEHVITFLRNKQGRRAGPPILDVGIHINFTEAPPEAYTRQELEDLFAVSCDDDKMLWRFFIGTGFRESEVAVAEYTDVNHDTKSIVVTEKPYFGFGPKDDEKRSVPISDDLIAQLIVRKNGSNLIFPLNGRPDGHLLRRLKLAAFNGGLNCGKCVGRENGKVISCADAPVCEKWILHKFRKNFATDREAKGARARKIQRWLGHSSLETTLRYLAVTDDTTDEVRALVNAVHVGL